MDNNIDNSRSDYENMIDKLSNQITGLFSKIHYYQALVAEKDVQISQLTNENSQLIAKIQRISQQLTPPPYPSQQSYTPPATKPQVDSTLASDVDTRIMKRQCPNCGAMGFAIKEVDDKTKILSYVPRRIYAKKRVCTKCRLEF